MTTTSHLPVRRKYHRNAYQFVFAALRFTQQHLGKASYTDPEDPDAHISGQELLQGIRDFARDQFGLMTLSVFREWGIRETDDFGRIVFELIEQGEMRKTDQDDLRDFSCLYDFVKAFDEEYAINTTAAFSD